MQFSGSFGTIRLLSRTDTNLCHAIRRLLARRGLSIAAVSRAAGIPRPRLTETLNGRAHLTSEQWVRLYRTLDVHAEIVAAIVKVLDAS